MKFARYVNFLGVLVMAVGLLSIYLLPRFLPERHRVAGKIAGLVILALGALWAIQII